MLWAFCMITLISRGEIIDRIAVAEGNQVITESEILRDIRITAFLNDTELDFSPQAKRRAADRLVEQKLVNKEMELTKYPGPEPEEIAQMLENTRKLRATNPEQFQRELEKYGITEADLKEHLVRQLTLLRFVDLRFRPGVQVTDADIKQYFEEHVAANTPKGSADRELSLEDYRQKIEQTLTEQRVDQELDEWLKQARQQARVEYHKEAFR
jgi:hypothetical protein